MNKIICILIIVCGISCQAVAQDNSEFSGDRLSIAKLLNENYLKGFYHDLDSEKIKAGFHEDFRLAISFEGELSYISLDDWMAFEGVGIPVGQLSDEQKAKEAATIDIKYIDVTGSSAAAKATISIEGELIYTNYYGLNKNNDKWTVVNKNFYIHTH